MGASKFLFLGLLLAAPIHLANCEPGVGKDDESAAPGFKAYKDDGVKWKFARRGRLVVISDVHGDIDALLAILVDAKLIELDGDVIKWIGGKEVQLVMMGDLISKGNHSADVLNLAMHLETLMTQAGAEFHMVPGNQEKKVLEGDYSSFTKGDIERFEKIGGMPYLFSDRGPYGKWLAKQNTILQIGDFIFTHRTLGEWALNFTIGEINATVREWFKFFTRGRLKPEEPKKRTRWAVGWESEGKGIAEGEGPFEADHLNPEATSLDQSGMFPKASLEKFLHSVGAKFLFLAHYASAARIGAHKLYGKLVWLTDSGIHDRENGAITYSNIPEGAEPEGFVTVARPEGKWTHPIREAGCLANLKAAILATLGK